MKMTPEEKLAVKRIIKSAKQQGLSGVTSSSALKSLRNLRSQHDEVAGEAGYERIINTSGLGVFRPKAQED